jgi:hypothetical protein
VGVFRHRSGESADESGEDRWVLEVVGTRAFRKSDFYETERGVFRVGADLARSMADMLPVWRRVLAPVVEEVAIMIGGSSERPVRVATKLTESPRGSGRGNVRAQRRLFAACRSCGPILDDPDRTVCDECLADLDAERTAKLAATGKATLAVMRSSPDDPARSPEATAKKREKSRSTSLAMRAWEREHGNSDPEVYDREIRPVIQRMTVPQLMKLTGLSQFHCWKVRKGDRRLHARHWTSVLGAAVGSDEQA